MSIITILDDTRSIIRICKLYYEDQVSQKEIAEKMQISRPQISRVLAYARDSGIVSIQIHNPFTLENQYESLLQEKFSLKDALVVDVQRSSFREQSEELGNIAGIRIESYLNDKNIIGIMSGNSVFDAVKHISSVRKPTLQFVPLVGGMGAAGANWHANFISRTLAEKTGGRSYVLNAPLIMQTIEAKAAIESEPHIQTVLQMGTKCNVILTGVGQIDEKATLVQSGTIDGKDIDYLKKSGAVAAVCSDFLDEKGHVINNEMTQRFIGLKIDALRACPRVVVIAFGEDKVKAIAAALRSGIVHELFTTLETAKLLVELKENEEN